MSCQAVNHQVNSPDVLCQKENDFIEIVGFDEKSIRITEVIFKKFFPKILFREFLHTELGTILRAFVRKCLPGVLTPLS